MSNLAVSRPTALQRFQRVLAGIFLPQTSVSPVRSMYEGDPQQSRRERPFRSNSTTRWFQGDIERAILLADSGDLALAARLARAMRRDATYAGILATRAGGLTRLPKIFRGTPEVMQDLEPPEGLGLFDRIFPPKELELLDGDGIALGVAVGELIQVPWRPEPLFVRLDPEFLRYNWNEDRWYFHTVGGRVVVTPGDGRWVLHCPGGYQAPWCNALWQSLGRAYIAKEHAYLHRENYSGKLANPARVAVSPSGASERERSSFFQKVMAWGVNTVFGLPPGWDVKLLESAGRGYEVYQQTIESADREFMIGLAGQTVTTDGGAGFSNAAVPASIRADIIQGDGNGLANTLNEQALRPIINLLYGASSRCSMQWDTRPAVDLKSEAEAISAAAKALQDANQALAQYGMKLDAREMATRFKLPVEISTQPAQALPTASAPDDASSPAVVSAGNDNEPTESAAEALARKMTEHGVVRCEHNSLNRCRLCGVERIRDFTPGLDGVPAWHVSWVPIEEVRDEAAQ